MKQHLLLPMATYVLYVWALGLHMFRTRVRAVKAGEVSPKYFRAYAGEQPDRLAIVGQHYDNQFQLPILYLVTGAFFLAMGTENGLTVILAWAFVLSRFAHSREHLGRNHVLRRAAAFFFGWLIVILMWAQLIYLTWRD
jgi:hypothetical protein